MKKNTFVLGLVTLLSVPAFGACDSKESSSNLITSSTEETLTHTQKLEKMLENLRKGVKFEGTVDQTVTFLTGAGGQKTDNVITNKYLPEIVYESSDRNAFGSTIYQELSATEKVLVFDNQFFEGEDGNTYYYDLNYDNTIQAFPLLDKLDNKPIHFYYAYANPFSYILAEDLIEVEGKENTYTLNLAKSTFFSSCVLSDIDTAFSNTVDSLEFTIENYELKSIKVVPQVEEASVTDYETFVQSFYEIEQVATLNITEIGTAKIRVPSTREVKPEHENLQNALAKYAGNNFTATLEVQLTRDTKATTALYTYYFDGESMYLSQVEDQSKPAASDLLFYHYEGEDRLTPLAYDADSGLFTRDANPSLASIESNFTYNDLCPEISGVSAALFDYQSFRKTYECCPEMVNRIANLAFVPIMNPVANYLEDTTKFLIRLDNEGFIDYISFSFEDNSFYAIEGKCELSFTNVGTTVLPHNLDVE